MRTCLPACKNSAVLFNVIINYNRAIEEVSTNTGAILECDAVEQCGRAAVGRYCILSFASNKNSNAYIAVGP